jgi:hypothetical protein
VLGAIQAVQVVSKLDQAIKSDDLLFFICIHNAIQRAIAHPICDRLRPTAGRSFWYVWNAGSGFVSGASWRVSIFLRPFLSHLFSEPHRTATHGVDSGAENDSPGECEAIFRPKMLPVRGRFIPPLWVQFAQLVDLA